MHIYLYISVYIYTYIITYVCTKNKLRRPWILVSLMLFFFPPLSLSLSLFLFLLDTQNRSVCISLKYMHTYKHKSHTHTHAHTHTHLCPNPGSSPPVYGTKAAIAHPNIKSPSAANGTHHSARLLPKKKIQKRKNQNWRASAVLTSRW